MKKIFVFLFFVAFMHGCSKSEVPSLSVTTGKQIQFDVDGGNSSLSFTTNQLWSAVSSANWCSLSQTSGEQGTITIDVVCQPNSEYQERDCSVIIIAAGLYQLINITQSPKIKVEPVPISSKIYGKWVVKKGNITGFLAEGQYSQNIEFKENGNYEETVYSGERQDVREVYRSSTIIGNWHGADNVIGVNDWNSDVVVEGIKVLDVSDETLVLDYQGNTLTYVRPSAEFANLEKDVLGSWYSITDSNHKGRLRFNEDGSGGYSQYGFSYLSLDYMVTSYNFTSWWVQDNTLQVKYSGYVLTASIRVDFINDKYIGISCSDGISGTEVMKR